MSLERYEVAFRDNEIDWEPLPNFTAEDLKDLEVVPGDHRRNLLEAIAASRSESFQQGSAEGQIASMAERRQLTVMFCDLVGSTAWWSKRCKDRSAGIAASAHRSLHRAGGGQRSDR